MLTSMSWRDISKYFQKSINNLNIFVYYEVLITIFIKNIYFHGTVETELKVTQSALDVHMGCTPFVKDW